MNPLSLVVSSQQESVGIVELNNPPHNYFSIDMLKQINSVLESFADTPSVRVVVLRSNGRSFCAGTDLGSRETKEKRRHKGEVNPLYQEAYKIGLFPKPIVAAIEGAAIGGGLGLALLADFRVSASEARFAANFSRLGFHPGFGLSFTLPRLVGEQHASRLFYTGETIRGDEAKSIGLVDFIVSAEQVRGRAMQLAQEIAVSSPRAVRSIRETMRRTYAENLMLAVVRESSVQADQFKSEDIAEGVKALSERRPPAFKD